MFPEALPQERVKVSLLLIWAHIAFEKSDSEILLYDLILKQAWSPSPNARSRKGLNTTELGSTLNEDGGASGGDEELLPPPQPVKQNANATSIASSFIVFFIFQLQLKNVS